MTKDTRITPDKGFRLVMRDFNIAGRKGFLQS
jgi:hypothetical protein